MCATEPNAKLVSSPSLHREWGWVAPLSIGALTKVVDGAFAAVGRWRSLPGVLELQSLQGGAHKVWMQQAVLPPGSRLCLREERLRLEVALDAEDVGDVGWVVVA